MLEHCTLPRTGALEVILDILGPNQKNGFSANSSEGNSLQLQDDSKISKIFDVTIAYPEGKPLDLFQIGFGSRPPCVTHVHYRAFDVKDVRFLTILLSNIECKEGVTKTIQILCYIGVLTKGSFFEPKISKFLFYS